MYEFLPHTADVRIRIEAPSLEELFRDALLALSAFVKPEGGGEPRERAVEVEASGLTDLLVDFLNDALWRMHAYRETYQSLEIHRLSANRIEATIRGRSFQSIQEDVKAVTYHEADVRESAKGLWSTVVVLDV